MANSRPLVLKNRNDFSRVKAKGRTVSSVPWLIANFCENEAQGLRIGWTIPSYVGTSVTRNRLKRWIRQNLKLLNGEILSLQCDINLVFRKRTIGFYKELSHGDLDFALTETYKKIKIRRR